MSLKAVSRQLCRGNRLHLSVESGPPCTQNLSESTSTEILTDECDSNIADEDVHNKPPNVLSNGEFIGSSAAHDKPKTVVFSYEDSKASGFVRNEQNCAENETRQQSIVSSVKVDPSGTHEEDTAITSACNISFAVKEECSFTVKEEMCTFHVDEKKQSESVVNAQESKLIYQSHNSADLKCGELGKSAEICRDPNVRTSLVCKAGTEIKIIQNTHAEKVEVQCITNLAENTFEIHRKPSKTTETIEQPCTVEENLKTKETVVQNALPYADNANSKESEPLIILSYMDSSPNVEDSSVRTSPINEREQCARVVSSPETDSNTILLDECELNIPDEDASVGSPQILPDAELIVTGNVYNEPDTDVLADDEEHLMLPPIKVEPCIILKEEQEPLNIPSCIDSSGIVKDEGLSTFPADEVKKDSSVIVIQELEPPCLTHGLSQCGCKAITNNFETCNDLAVRSPLTRRITRQSARAEKEEAQRLTEFTKNISKSAKKQLDEITRSLGTKEQGHAYTEPKIILGSEDPPLEAILPCVDIDLSLLKEEQEPVAISSSKSPVPVIQESNLTSFSGGEKVIKTSELKQLSSCLEGSEPTVKECRNLSVKTRACRTRNKASWNSYAEDEESDSTTKSKGNTPKSCRKRRQKTRSSCRRFRAPQTKEHNLVYNEHEETQLQAILPCIDVDPSLLKDETEPVVISACKDPVPKPRETNLFIFPGDDSKPSTHSEQTQLSSDELGEKTEVSEDSSTSNVELHIPRSKARQVKPCVTDEEIRCMVDFTKEALEQREKKLQQIREAVYRKRSSETEEQRRARLEKDKLRQRKRRAEETEEQREKRLLTMRLHKRIKRSMNSATGLQKDFLDYYMEEMFKYPETQEEQGSPLNMIVSIDPSWVVRTVEKQQFKCAVETEEQRKTRLEKDMLRQRKKRAEETPEQRAKRLETMRINKRIRRAMETEEQRHKRLEYSRERQLFRRLNETEEQRRERLEREKLRQRQKRATESSEERDLRLRAARERMRMRLSDPTKVTDIIDNLLSSDSLSSMYECRLTLLGA